MSISFESTGDFRRTEKWLLSLQKLNVEQILNKYGREGVAALSAATPYDSGGTANAWDYTISKGRGSYSITWTNGNTQNGFPVAVMLQYGHGTGTGGYVVGRDYINPAMRPIFDKIAADLFRAVKSA